MKTELANYLNAETEKLKAEQRAEKAKQKNLFRIKISEVAENEGMEDVSELLEVFAYDSVMPACCSEGCQVEPDGRCEHGCPSILLAMGVI